MRQTKRLLLGILLLTSVSAFADSINSSTFSIQLNYGSGASILGVIRGPGLNLTVAGGTDVNWFSDFGYAPGSTGGGGTPVYWEGEFGEIGSQQYNYFQLFAYSSFLSTGSFTFPTNGEDFSITMPASISDIDIVTICPLNCPTFDIPAFSGTITMWFDYSSNTGLYYGSLGSLTSAPPPATTPEPGALGLMATGIGALTWLRVRRKVA